MAQSDADWLNEIRAMVVRTHLLTEGAALQQRPTSPSEYQDLVRKPLSPGRWPVRDPTNNEWATPPRVQPARDSRPRSLVYDPPVASRRAQAEFVLQPDLASNGDAAFSYASHVPAQTTAVPADRRRVPEPARFVYEAPATRDPYRDSVAPLPVPAFSAVKDQMLTAYLARDTKRSPPRPETVTQAPRPGPPEVAATITQRPPPRAVPVADAVPLRPDLGRPAPAAPLPNPSESPMNQHIPMLRGAGGRAAVNDTLAPASRPTDPGVRSRPARPGVVPAGRPVAQPPVDQRREIINAPAPTAPAPTTAPASSPLAASNVVFQPPAAYVVPVIPPMPTTAPLPPPSALQEEINRLQAHLAAVNATLDAKTAAITTLTTAAAENARLFVSVQGRLERAEMDRDAAQGELAALRRAGSEETMQLRSERDRMVTERDVTRDLLADQDAAIAELRRQVALVRREAGNTASVDELEALQEHIQLLEGEAQAMKSAYAQMEGSKNKQIVQLEERLTALSAAPPTTATVKATPEASAQLSQLQDELGRSLERVRELEGFKREFLDENRRLRAQMTEQLTAKEEQIVALMRERLLEDEMDDSPTEQVARTGAAGAVPGLPSAAALADCEHDLRNVVATLRAVSEGQEPDTNLLLRGRVRRSGTPAAPELVAQIPPLVDELKDLVTGLVARQFSEQLGSTCVQQ